MAIYRSDQAVVTFGAEAALGGYIEGAAGATSTSTATSTIATTAASAGDMSITVAAIGNFALQQFIYIGTQSSAANRKNTEVRKVVGVSGNVIYIDAPLGFDHALGQEVKTIVTKANIVKTTDGKFLDVASAVGKRYPEIDWEGWYIDIMTAKLLDKARRTKFQVFAMPNLYGDILTDEAAEIQGGVGTAGSANLGKQYGMFEAIHGSAPRMVKEGRTQYADPSSVMRAGAMMLEHIGFVELGNKLHKALDICGQYEKKIVITGRDTGTTSKEFGEYLMNTVLDPNLESRWERYVKA